MGLRDFGKLNSPESATAQLEFFRGDRTRQLSLEDHHRSLCNLTRQQAANVLESHIMAVDAEVLGQRIAEARGRARLTQADLAIQVGLDRPTISKIETGSRGVSAIELSQLAVALGVRIEWFMEDAPPAIISRRNVQEPGAPSPAIDISVERVARAIEFAADHDTRFTVENIATREMPNTSTAADSLASDARALIGADDRSPLVHLDEKLSHVGLLAFTLSLGVDSADAATIALRNGGASVINGDLHIGRRRLALAHEFGHFLVADEYTVDWRVAEYQDAEIRENLFDRFARSLLLPEQGIRDHWRQYTQGEVGDFRAACIQIASNYRVDMTTLARRLLDLGIITWADAAKIRSFKTTRADITEMGLVVGSEMDSPAIPAVYERSVLRLFRAETISTARALDLLFNTYSVEDLPTLPRRADHETWQFI